MPPRAPADVVLLAIGESFDMSGEAQSRTEIAVPAAQQELAEAVAAVGKPVVVVLKHGRALALEGAVADAQAILATWFLGTETGNAIADVLFGAYGPSARLPASFPWESGQEPYYYAHKATGRPNPPGELQPYKAHFRGIPNSARYPFGHGLTYGKIEYSRLSLSSPTMPMNGTIEMSAHPHKPRQAGRRGGRAALYPRSRGQRHQAGARAESLPQDCACAGRSRRSCASRSRRPISPFTDAGQAGDRTGHLRPLDRAIGGG